MLRIVNTHADKNSIQLPERVCKKKARESPCRDTIPPLCLMSKTPNLRHKDSSI